MNPNADWRKIEDRTPENGWDIFAPMAKTYNVQGYTLKQEDLEVEGWMDTKPMVQRALAIAEEWVNKTELVGFIDIDCPLFHLACAIIQTDYFLDCYRWWTPKRWLAHIHVTAGMEKHWSQEDLSWWYDIENCVEYYIKNRYQISEKYDEPDEDQTLYLYTVISLRCKEKHRAFDRPAKRIQINADKIPAGPEEKSKTV